MMLLVIMNMALMHFASRQVIGMFLTMIRSVGRKQTAVRTANVNSSEFIVITFQHSDE